MFDVGDAIPVVFGPHEGDVWMIAATLLSFSASLVLGVSALKNGMTATRIAKEASDRDEADRVAERERLRDEKRHAAAAAMTRSFWALDAAIRFAQNSPGTDEALRMQDKANNLKIEAVVEIELLHPDEQPVPLSIWFERTWARMKSFADETTRNPYRGEAIGSVRRWKSRIVGVDDFLDPARRL
ncbi:hypothetical protein [Leucobacter sp. VD1]|uniref:hypothetical protein n=1 Tax=Leucobacter sp. VD1 TaxID=3080381 RepID=UPI00301B16CD